MAAGGTTSACAENTHLRLRNIIRSRELPPRARRIHAWYSAACNAIGTTSACAENTGDSFSYRRTIGNYLRVRGEYLATAP